MFFVLFGMFTLSIEEWKLFIVITKEESLDE